MRVLAEVMRLFGGQTKMDSEPIELAGSDLLIRRESLITVGHPAIVLRLKPFLTSDVSLMGLNADECTALHVAIV